MDGAEVVIVDGARTCIGKFGGVFRDVEAATLGASVIREAARRSGVQLDDVDEVVMGCVGQVAEDAFLARRCALAAGVKPNSGALTVNRLCGSGLQAIITAVNEIKCGDARIVIAGGTENMSRLPYYVRRARWGYRMGHAELEDGVTSALTDPFGRYHMGVTAEIVADRYSVSRRDQDEFACRSQARAIRAIDEGRFKDEIVPLEVPAGKGQTSVAAVDEHPRRDVTVDSLSRLRPAFKEGGTVTAGNSSGINDGAAAVVLMEARTADELGLLPKLRVVSWAVHGVEPEVMGIAPVGATRKALERAGLVLDDIDLVELNEAFAAQAVACIRELDLDIERVNVNGGAIALGHPIGATGSILTVKLMYEMHKRMSRYGVVTMCIGGGQGIAAVFERL